MPGIQAQHLREGGPGVGGWEEPGTTPGAGLSAASADPSTELRAIAANAGDNSARSLREAMEAAQSAGATHQADLYRAALFVVLRANSELVVPVEGEAA